MTSEKLELQKLLGFIIGVTGLLLLLAIPAPEGLDTPAWHTAAVAVLMAALWITEAIPIAVTALLPIVMFPLLQITSVSEATAPYANPLIFLFMGGFIIAIAMQTWDLHRRIALRIINFVGTKGSSIIIGFIIASAFLSMWVSNTATTLMMLPIALSVLELIEDRFSGEMNRGTANFKVVLVLSIAYASNVGGMGTLIGTPPNALLSGFMLQNYGYEISFLQWMFAGVPLVVISLPLLYLLLTKVIYPVKLEELPGGDDLIHRELEKIGPITGPEKKVLVVFIITALLWMTRPLLSNVIPGLSDAGIAIAAAIVLFLVPVDFRKGIFLLRWQDLRNLPWGVLILFGGGLSLASAISETGLADWIGGSVEGMSSWPIILVTALTAFIIVFFTEITSNTATTAAFLPILASAAIGVNQNPLLLAVPAALSASCAFMLPVATPPNAIVYGSGRISIPDMAKAGIFLNILFIFLVTAMTYLLIIHVFGITIGIVPEWTG